jgi:hypothetical protein
MDLDRYPAATALREAGLCTAELARSCGTTERRLAAQLTGLARLEEEVVAVIRERAGPVVAAQIADLAAAARGARKLDQQAGRM